MENYYPEYKLLLNNYLDNYSKEYGERSAKKIMTTVIKSKHSLNLLNQSSAKRTVPNAGDFNSFVLSNFSLSFANTSKIKFASIILLNYWHTGVNLPEDLASEPEVIFLFEKILNSTT